ncbi:hypothetical protein EYC84_010109 [Monilinia fructicola]|uniref:Uncharacterized protein n=1 Tax=Monilinia fructicola TaxID=38448 RepID=A0A5M9JIU8_MONFR|nr:hypothetical protein EYC84_010109 [Monilinia fructicola]
MASQWSQPLESTKHRQDNGIYFRVFRLELCRVMHLKKKLKRHFSFPSQQISTCAKSCIPKFINPKFHPLFYRTNGCRIMEMPLIGSQMREW